MTVVPILSTVMLLMSSLSYANEPDPTLPADYVQTGRYSHVVNEPYLAQQNPLKVVVSTRIPMTVQNVQQAITYLLARSGYRLAEPSILTREAKILLNHDLPQIHRYLGPMTLDKALQTLGGDAFELVVDPINRKVTFVASRDLIGG